MEAIKIFQKRWTEEARFRPFHPYPNIDDDGLALGAATILAPMTRDRFGAPALAVEGNEEKILALLSLGYRRRISLGALKFIKRASMQWARGEKALAHFELAYARLPRFEAREDARLLFYADGLVQLGIPPRALMRYVGIDTRELDLLKYNRDEPRVPAGYGGESGEWTSGAGEVTSDENPDNNIQEVSDVGEKLYSFKTGNMEVMAVYDFGTFQVIVNVGQRIAPDALSIDSPLIQNGNILNDNVPP